MPKILPFKRRPRGRWTKPGAYGASGGLRFWPDPKKQVTARGLFRDTIGWLGALRPVFLFAFLLSIWPMADPALVEPPSFLAGEPERVSERFTRCGLGRGHACVIDGDTFRLGKRKVRVVGIDTAEVDAHCPAEAREAERSAAALQRLLNQGAFEMVGRSFNDTDRYGRDLRVVRRVRPDGTIQSIADDMRASGGAQRYLGGFRSGWC